jgi:hypothetical protein
MACNGFWKQRLLKEGSMRFALALFVFALSALPAAADVAAMSPGALVIHAETRLAVPPRRVWAALIHPGQWWSSAHTYSGDAHNLSLDARAGGCWCERFGASAVEHARVIMILHRDGTDMLRLSGAIGPLQEMAVNGVLTFTITGDGAGAKIEMTYRVSGDPGLHLDGIASGVDTVLLEQFARLGRYANTGRPD